MKMKGLALAQVRRGERFTLDGVEFVKLEDDLDAAFVVAGRHAAGVLPVRG